MSKLNQLGEYGQSIWLDYIRRSFIENGELQSFRAIVFEDEIVSPVEAENCRKM